MIRFVSIAAFGEALKALLKVKHGVYASISQTWPDAETRFGEGRTASPCGRFLSGI